MFFTQFQKSSCLVAPVKIKVNQGPMLGCLLHAKTPAWEWSKMLCLIKGYVCVTMKWKDLNLGVLPVAALNMGRGEVLMAPSPDRGVQTRSPGNVLEWPHGSQYAHGALFDSKAGAASKKGGEATDCSPFGIWPWPWARRFQTDELNTGCVAEPLRGLSRPSHLQTVGLACRNFTGFPTQHCRHMSRPTLLPSPSSSFQVFQSKLASLSCFSFFCC